MYYRRTCRTKTIIITIFISWMGQIVSFAITPCLTRLIPMHSRWLDINLHKKRLLSALIVVGKIAKQSD